MKKFFTFLIFALSLSATAFAQRTIYLDPPTGNFIDVDFQISPDSVAPNTREPMVYVVPAYGDWDSVLPAELVDGKIVLLDPSEIYLNMNTSRQYAGLYMGVDGEWYVTEPVTLAMPKTEFVFDYEIEEGILKVKAQIVGLENYNLKPHFGKGYQGNELHTFFVFHDVSDFGKDTYFEAVETEKFTFEGRFSLENIVSKGILSAGITLADEDGNIRTADTDLRWFLGKEGLNVTSNPSRFGYHQIFFPESEMKTAMLFDMNGRELSTFHIYSGDSISFHDIPQGMKVLIIEGYAPVKIL